MIGTVTNTILLGLAFCVCIGCTPPDEPGAPDAPASHETPLVPDGWQLIKAGDGFTFKAPPDLVQQQVQGIDSFVGEYVSPGMVLSFDFGWYSDPMDRQGYERSDTTIDGRAAYIARNGDEMGVHFPTVDKSSKSETKVKLTMYVKLNGADPKAVETIFHTIDFPDE